MMRIGEIAALAGVSTRAVRHYHARRVLPEPPRRSNGYREYRSRDLLMLLRVVRLSALGLSLDEVRDVLGDASGTELQDILAEVAADLQYQQQELDRRRALIAAALAADDYVNASPRIAALIARIGSVIKDPNLVRAEHEALELMEVSMTPTNFADLTDGYQQMLDDPAAMSAVDSAQQQFAGLTDQGPDDPQVVAVAAQLREIGAGVFGDGTKDSDGAADSSDATETIDSQGSGDDRAWQLFLDTLAPAQRHAVRLASSHWES